MKKILKYLSIIIFVITAITGCEEEKVNVAPPVDTRLPVHISTTPAGATFFMDDKEMITPCDIKLEPTDSILLKLEKVNYKPKWTKIICTSANLNNYNINLTPITGTIILVTEPSGAKVTMNDKYYGETPVLLKNLPIGNHRATLKKDSFVEKVAIWDIINARPKKITKLMDSNVGEIVIKSIPSKAKVYINDELRGFTPFQKDIENGEYKIKVELEGYITYQQITSIKRDKTEEINATLTELPGTLIVKSVPSDVTLFVNGKQYKNTPTTIKNLSPGDYELRLELATFDPSYKKIKLDRGQELTINFDLKSNTGGIDLCINPPGVTIYVNGKIKGITKISNRTGK